MRHRVVTAGARLAASVRAMVNEARRRKLEGQSLDDLEAALRRYDQAATSARGGPAGPTRDAIVAVATDHKRKPRVRRIAAIVLVLMDHGAEALWDETEAAQVAADILETLDHAAHSSPKETGS